MPREHCRNVAVSAAIGWIAGKSARIDVLDQPCERGLFRVPWENSQERHGEADWLSARFRGVISPFGMTTEIPMVDREKVETTLTRFPGAATRSRRQSTRS